MLTDPQSPEEWQTAVNLAAFVLVLDSLCQYGLIETKTQYDVDRAHALLEEGAARGYFPPDDQPSVAPAIPSRRKRGQGHADSSGKPI